MRSVCTLETSARFEVLLRTCALSAAAVFALGAFAVLAVFTALTGFAVLSSIRVLAVVPKHRIRASTASFSQKSLRLP